MNLHQLRDQLRNNEHRRSAVRDQLLKLDAEHPDMDYSPEQRRHFDSLTAEAEQLRKEETELRRKIEDRTTLDALARTASGIALGSAFAAPEIRVFRNQQATAPSDFDGEIMHAQDGSRVPLLGHRHRLTDFVATERRGPKIGFAQYLRTLYSGATNDDERRALAEGSIGTGGAVGPGGPERPDNRRPDRAIRRAQSRREAGSDEHASAENREDPRLSDGSLEKRE